MSYTNLGKIIKQEREKRGWEQSDLAKRVTRKQQTVSRWELGISRPNRDDLFKLVELFSGNPEIWLTNAGYEFEEPDVSLSPYLPIHNLTPENFELFCRDFIQAVNPTAEVFRYGSQGYKQEGIDLLARYPRETLDYQCKRLKQFGPQKIELAINKTTVSAIHHHILLSRNATPEARKKILQYSAWSLWDREDISTKLRGLRNKDDAIRIVDTYFPGKRKTFLGIPEPSIWLPEDKFFLQTSDRSKLFNHGWTFVGRQNELRSLEEFAKQKGEQALIISGRGGIGKTRLLKAWTNGIKGSEAILFVSPGSYMEPKDIELLPNGTSYLVIDDAHERQDLAMILNSVSRYKPNLKIVISTRPYGIFKVEDDLAKAGISFNSKELISLGDLDVRDAENLANEILNIYKEKRDKRLGNRIAQVTKDCPLATVIGSRLVGQGMIDPELLNNEKQFRDGLLRSFRDAIAGDIGGKNPQDIRDLLDFLATIQPFDPYDPGFQSSAEKVLSDHIDQIIRNIAVLEDAGIVIRRGNSCRVVPDLFADYVRFKASYDERNDRPTGYVDRIYRDIDGDLSTHLLINISQIDWRLSTENVQSMLLKSVWKQIFSVLKSSDNMVRCLVLKKLREAAYYQPKQFIELTEFILENPAGSPENPELSGLHSYQHKDVLNELPEILRRISYDLEYLPQCADLLWEIGRGDIRQTNPYPEHGIRILQDLAKYEIYEFTGKSLVVQELMLEAIKRWMSDTNLENYYHSPLDVLDKLLDKESTTDTYQRGTVTIHSFGIHYSNTKNIRGEALKLVIESAKLPNIRISLRAIKSLGYALREPMAILGRTIKEEEFSEWIPFQLSVLDGIDEVVSVQQHPIIYFELKCELAWHIRHSKSDNIRKRSSALFENLSKSFDVQLIQALDQNRDHEWLIEEDEYDFYKNTEMSLRFRRGVANEFIKRYPNPRKGYAELYKVLEELNNCRENPFPIIFFSEMSRTYPDYVISICEEILNNPSSSISRYIGYFLYGLVDKNLLVTRKFITKGININEEKILESIADYYWRGIWIKYFNAKEDLPDIQKLLDSKFIFVKILILGGIGRLGNSKPAVAKKLLLAIDLSNSKELAKEYFLQFNKKYSFDPDLLKDEELAFVLNKLRKVDYIDDYHIEEFINYAGTRLPLLVVSFLLNRIEESKTDGNLHPISYTSRTFLHGFKNTKLYSDVLREVRNKIFGHDWQNRFWIPKLFKSISNDFDPIGLSVLNEWIDSGELEKIKGVGLILHDAPENFLFDHQDFVSRMLYISKLFGRKFIKSIEYDLTYSAIFQFKHGSPGQPMVEDVELRDQCQKMLVQYPIGSLEYELFDTLRKHAITEIEDKVTRDEDVF